MTGIQSLETRAALGGLFAIASYIAASSAGIHRLSQKIFDRAVNAAFIITRLGLYILTFFILHLSVRGDVPTFYVLPAEGTLHHLLPYRDFPTSYAPLHSYLDAAILLLWHSPLAIILFAILVECLILPIWLRVARLFVSEPCARIAAVLYLTSAIGVQFVAIDGQDNVVLAVLLGLALLALARHRAALSGVLIAAGIAIIKFLPLLFAPAFFLISSRRLRWLAGFIVALVAGYAYFVIRHVPILFPFTFEHADRGASNLPYIVEGILNFVPPSIVEDGLMGLALLAILVLLARIALRRPDTATALRTITFGCTALTLALLILSRKSWPPYLVMTLFPVCLLLGQGSRLRLRLACFALFNVVAVTSHSFWATVFRQFEAPAFHQALAASLPSAWLFLILQVALVAGYIWLLVETICTLSRKDSSAPADKVQLSTLSA
jgi:hypothetical protein